VNTCCELLLHVESCKQFLISVEDLQKECLGQLDQPIPRRTARKARPKCVNPSAEGFGPSRDTSEYCSIGPFAVAPRGNAKSGVGIYKSSIKSSIGAKNEPD
jgi:hypothetical protein